jgi:DNA-binding response OmpR family regulator
MNRALEPREAQSSLSKTLSTDSPQPDAVRPRRALIITDSDSGASLSQTLATAGYEALLTTSGAALRSIDLFTPDVCLMILEPGGASVENSSITLARRLRAESATYALPIVLLWSEDEGAARKSALNVGVDDYFSLGVQQTELLARLDALFWRVEAGRRAASTIGDQRLEIDNFMLMLDSVREEMRAGAKGTLALIYALAREGDDSFDREARDRILAEAHGFLKLHLRRIDAVAFYGPTTLLVYLPRMRARHATEALAKLRGEFMFERTDGEIVVGLASFPADGSDVESLIEKAEQAVSLARLGNSPASRIVAYNAQDVTDTLSSVATSIATAPHVKPETPRVKETVAAETKSAEAKPIVVTQPAASNLQPQAAREETIKGLGEIKGIGETRSAAAKGNGATLGAADAARLAAEAAAHERERRAQGAVMPRRLLLTVSDAARMAQLNSLIRSAGYEARAAFDGQQALDLLRIERPDLLLLDYELHGIDGVEMLRRLRKQNGGRMTLPVVMLLPPDNESARLEALELGARRIVQTPYDPSDLLASVRLAGSSE